MPAVSIRPWPCGPSEPEPSRDAQQHRPRQPAPPQGTCGVPHRRPPHRRWHGGRAGHAGTVDDGRGPGQSAELRRQHRRRAEEQGRLAHLRGHRRRRRERRVAGPERRRPRARARHPGAREHLRRRAGARRRGAGQGPPRPADGVDPDAQFKLKRWWSVDAGRAPRNDHEFVAGAKAARVLGLQMGDYVRIRGKRFTLTGILRPTGAQDDDLLIADLGAVQKLLGRPGELTLIEVAAVYSGASVDQIVRQLSRRSPTPRSRPSARRSRAGCTRSTSSRASASRSSVSSSVSRSSWCSSP